MAAIKDTDAETGVHRLFKEHGLVPPVEISEVDLGFPTLGKFPIIKLREWVQYLLDSGLLWRQMTGCSTFEKMKTVLKEFWDRMKHLKPGFGIFGLAEQGILDLECTIPVYSHTDEGRSLKKQPIFILSTHGLLGRGTHAYLRSQRQKAPLHRNGMGMNFISHPMATHFIFACFLKAVSDKHAGSLDKIMALYSEDVESLLLNGVTSKDMSKQVWICHMGTKGDLPALQRVGHLKRNFLRAPKAKASKKPAVGICHLCSAGKEQCAPDGLSNNYSPFPYEDLGARPAWLSTVGQEVPWDHYPEVLNGVCLGDQFPASFFHPDLWHSFHLGLAKHWVASGLVAVVEYLDIPNDFASSVDKKFEWLNTTYQQFCREHGRCGWVKHIDKDLLNFTSSTVCPIGSWNKGSASTHLMKFLEWFSVHYIEGKTSNEILKAVDPLWATY